MHTLLLGNGINRLLAQLDWMSILDRLADSVPGAENVRHLEQKPLSMYFEELCAIAAISKPFRNAEIDIKRRIAGLLQHVAPNPLLHDFVDLFPVILTTNYDHAIEEAIAGPLYERRAFMPESRYSLFRRSIADSKVVWHIHGDILYPETILLGYDHYSGYLQKIRNYQTGPMPHEMIKCLLANHPDISRTDPACVNLFSWVDHFLRDHLHIVGLGLDFTEMDLWWLLVYKRRKNRVTGLTFYYQIEISEENDEQFHPHLSLLRSLGVEVQTVFACTYRSGYEKILELVRDNMAAHPTLLDEFRHPPTSKKDSTEWEVRAPSPPSPQFSLKFRKAKKTV
jgi:hypothetical protein